MRYPLIFILALILAGCAKTQETKNEPEPLISAKTREDIAICSAGIEVSKGVKASLSAGLEKEKKSFNGALSAEYKEAARNTILSDATLSEELKKKYLDLYFPCAEKRLAAGSGK